MLTDKGHFYRKGDSVPAPAVSKAVEPVRVYQPPKAIPAAPAMPPIAVAAKVERSSGLKTVERGERRIKK